MIGASRRIRVAVDLTPLRGGGENGGAKTLVITLLQEFARYRTDDFEYLLIAEPWNYEELKNYQSDNIVCQLKSEIYGGGTQSSSKGALPSSTLRGKTKPGAALSTAKLKGRVVRFAKRVIAKLAYFIDKVASKVLNTQNPVSNLFDRLVRTTSARTRSGILQGKHRVDLLFCPFSAPTLAEHGLPLVAIGYDFQHFDLPFFFDDIERAHRTRFLNALNYQSQKIICISDFTRQSFIKHLNTPLDKLTAIPICIHERLEKKSDAYVESVLASQGLQRDCYLFFPANFWPHKNHSLLLAAYSIYQQKFTDQALDLVFTGALQSSQETLESLVHKMGLSGRIHFLGFLNQDELIAIWQGTKGLIFPSLYEGFGIPVLEAFWFDKPVACSNIGSLPEVGGDAVIYFNPRKPEAVAKAMGQLAHDQDACSRLQVLAKDRLQHFKKQRMTSEYLSVFEAVIAKK
ncbi:glycosyl transferase, group 1 family protein [Synechococcus sp. PCC 7335]|uniref:glycosyltransferase family 4 protein n=1 Tax=Synechococcus sp. (strain ATCC 29403 / PCC 7335) TaxID=91464 RepID=UPI00017ED27F|nr:glycosyltransferase family 1 protein [Synechococcus sp. PCC 7335]EDX87662.1 glycosyl transferase, group 1 family protein [Synechococcus sp. PCC 7335]